MTLDTLAKLPTRCASGFDLARQHPGLCECAEASGPEWVVFVTALKRARRDDGTVHQGDVRPIIRGHIRPKHIGALYRRAKADGLIADTGEREPSNDTAGRNTDKLDRIYRWSAR